MVVAVVGGSAEEEEEEGRCELMNGLGAADKSSKWETSRHLEKHVGQEESGARRRQASRLAQSDLKARRCELMKRGRK